MVRDLQINYYESNEYCITRRTKKMIQNAMKRLQKNFDKTLFEDLNLNVTADFALLPEQNNLFKFLKENEEMFNNTTGCVHQAYIDNIFFQQSAVLKKKSKNIHSQRAEQLLIHEMGHRFDILYGNIDDSLEKKYKEIVTKHNLSGMDYSDEELKLINKYVLQNSYSDRDDFAFAVQKDLENIDINNPEIVDKYEYFIRQILYLSEGKKPTLEHIINADNSRSEIFAEAFSYLNGTKDDSKKEFLTTFSNAVNVVKKYMKKHMNK